VLTEDEAIVFESKEKSIRFRQYYTNAREYEFQTLFIAFIFGLSNGCEFIEKGFYKKLFITLPFDILIMPIVFISEIANYRENTMKLRVKRHIC
jgi:hypothetical protein